jgi:hypothetical protein
MENKWRPGDQVEVEAMRPKRAYEFGGEKACEKGASWNLEEKKAQGG